MSTKRTQEEMMNGAYDDHDDDVAGTIANNEGSRYDRLERLKREKRLAMNRECARVRRRRKKMRMEHLETRVQQLTQTNGRLQEENEAMLARVAQLEMELNRTRAQRALGISSGAGATTTNANPTSLPPSAASLLGGSATFDLTGNSAAGTGASTSAASSLEEQLLQRRAALAAAGLNTKAAGLADPIFSNGNTTTKNSLVESASAAAALERAEKLRYMEMLQQQALASNNAGLLGRDSPSFQNVPIENRLANSLLATARAPLAAASSAGIVGKPELAGLFY